MVIYTCTSMFTQKTNFLFNSVDVDDIDNMESGTLGHDHRFTYNRYLIMLLISHSAVHSSSNDKKRYLHVRIDKFMNYDKLKKFILFMRC